MDFASILTGQTSPGSGADFVLYLGGIAFEDFEIPESIRAGGEQSVFIHKYPGGTRTVDTMGPDDADISWTGFFEDESAQSRCQQIDIMRRQGWVVPLQWDAYLYAVVVKSFEWDFKRFYHIPYSISLVVVQDLTQPIPQLAPDIDEQVLADLNDAIADAASLGDEKMQSALALISSTLGTITSLATAGSSVLQTLALQIGNSQAIASQILTATDAAVAGVGIAENFASGVSPQSMISNIGSLVTQTANLNSAFDLGSKLGRMSSSVASLWS